MPGTVDGRLALDDMEVRFLVQVDGDVVPFVHDEPDGTTAPDAFPDRSPRQLARDSEPPERGAYAHGAEEQPAIVRREEHASGDDRPDVCDLRRGEPLPRTAAGRLRLQVAEHDSPSAAWVVIRADDPHSPPADDAAELSPQVAPLRGTVQTADEPGHAQASHAGASVSPNATAPGVSPSRRSAAGSPRRAPWSKPPRPSGPSPPLHPTSEPPARRRSRPPPSRPL